MLNPVTQRAQILGGGFNNPDVEALLRLTMEDAVMRFPELYRESPTYQFLPKSRWNDDIIQWAISDSRDSFIKQPRDTALLWSDFPNDPDTRKFIYSNVVTAEHRLDYEMVGKVQFNNTEVLNAIHAGHPSIGAIYQQRFNEAIRVLARDLNRDIYVGVKGPLPTQGPIAGLESIFSFVTAGTPSATDADYLLNNLYHGKPATATAIEGTDYFIKWRPLLGTWDDVANTLTIHDGHGNGADAGSGLNASGGTAEVPDKERTGVEDLKNALDQFDLEMRTRGIMYDAIFAGPETEYLYKKAYDQTLSRQIENGEISMPELATSIMSFYRGKPIVVDKFCPENRFYFLARNAVEFASLNFARIPGGSVDLTTMAMPISLGVGPLVTNKLTVETFALLLRPGLVCREPWGLSCLRLA